MMGGGAACSHCSRTHPHSGVTVTSHRFHLSRGTKGSHSSQLTCQYDQNRSSSSINYRTIGWFSRAVVYILQVWCWFTGTYINQHQSRSSIPTFDPLYSLHSVNIVNEVKILLLSGNLDESISESVRVRKKCFALPHPSPQKWSSVIFIPISVLKEPSKIHKKISNTPLCNRTVRERGLTYATAI